MRRDRPGCRWLLALGVGWLGTAAVAQTSPSSRRSDGLGFANAQLKERRYDLAAEEFERVLKASADPAEAADARYGLASARLYLGQNKEARRQFEAFLEAAPRHANAPTAWFRVGEAAYMLRDYPAARRALETYTAGAPGHRFLDMGWTYLGDVCLALKDLPAARVAFERSRKDFPEGRMADRAGYGLARTMAGLGESGPALEVLADLRRRDAPEWADKVRAQLGEVHAAAARADEAAGRAEAAASHYKEAVEAYESLEKQTSRSPLVAESRLHRAEALLKLDRLVEAETLLKSLAAEGPPALGASASYLLGDAQWSRGQGAEARSTWDAAAARDPASPRAPMLRYRAVEATAKLGEAQKARADFAKFADDYPKDPWADDALLRAAALALDAKDAEAARALAARLLASYPASPQRADARLLEARALLAADRPKEAIASLKRVDRERPSAETSQAALYQLSLAYRADGQADMLAETLRAMSRGPASPMAANAQFLAGQAAAEAGRWAEAVEPLEAYLKAQPKGDVADAALAYLARAQAQLDHPDRSVAALDRLAADFPDSPRLPAARAQLAEDALAADKPAEAAALFRVAARVDDPKLKAQALSGLGYALLKAQKPIEAAEAFGALLEAAPGDALAPESALLRATALDLAGKVDEAVAALDLLAAKYPESEPAAAAVLAKARLLARSRRPAEAADLYGLYLRDHREGGKGPDAADALYAEWGAALLDADKPADADIVFRSLLAAYPDGPRAAEARVNLADSAFLAKDYEQVETLLGPVLAEGSKAEPPAVASALFRLGRSKLDRRRPAEAVALFARLIADHADDAARLNARFWRAEASFQAGDAKAAEVDFAALTAQPSAEGWARTAKLRRVQCLVSLERWTDALAAADALKAEAPDLPQVAELDYARGRAFQQQARPDEALAAYQAVLDAPSKGVDLAARAQLMRGEVYFHKAADDQGYADALREFLLVDFRYDAPKWQAAALLEAGKVYEKLNKWTEAAELYEKLAAKFPGDPSTAEAARRREAAKAKLAAGDRATPR